MNGSFDDLQAAFKKAEAAYQRAHNKYILTRKARDEACLHTEVEKTSDYCGGGYDYTSSTTYKIHCKCCRKELQRWVKDHGYFG